MTDDITTRLAEMSELATRLSALVVERKDATTLQRARLLLRVEALRRGLEVLVGNEEIGQ